MLLMVEHGSAQEHYYDKPDRTFYGGLVAGLNLSAIENIDYPRYRKTGLSVGGIVYMKFAKQIAGSVELLYSQKGTRIKTARASNMPGVAITSVRTNLNYAEIPVMINYFNRKEGIFGIGLSYSRLVSSSDEINTYPNQHIDPVAYPFKSDDIELLAGGNLRLWKGLFLSLRFQYSVAKIRTNVPAVFTPQSQYNNLWLFRLMYLFQ